MSREPETRWAVVAQYEHSGYERNEIISTHRTYDLAAGAARGCTMRSIVEVQADARKGDNVRALEIAEQGANMKGGDGIER